MNQTELKYSLLSIVSLILSVYAFYKSEVIPGLLMAVIGMFFGIKSTEKGHPKWKRGIVAVIVGVILGYIIAAALLKSITS